MSQWLTINMGVDEPTGSEKSEKKRLVLGLEEELH